MSASFYKIKKYQKAILESLEEYKSQFKKIGFDMKPYIIADEKKHHYQFLWMGWKGDEQIFNVPIHIEIKDGKIWVQKDNTEDGIANYIVDKGISKKEIVLAYFTPAHRELTEFAIN